MDGLAWGMHYQRVANQYQQKIRDVNQEALKNAGGAVEEDNVRAKIRRELNRLKQSYIQFDGKPTGYESSLVSTEFTHNNAESMLMWDAEKFVEYLFFFDGRFWKRVRAFRQEMFGGQMTFEDYVKSLTDHFGPGKEIRNDAGKLTEVQWQNNDTYMFAQDQSGFFGVYCLVFVAKVTYENLDKLRPNAGLSDGTVQEDVSSDISSVTTGTLSDQEPSAIDSYTGVNQEGPTPTIDSGDSVMSKQQRKQIEKDQKQEEKKRKMTEQEKSDLFDDLF
jgi:hypothetical protein